jgi:hypothetical protein
VVDLITRATASTNGYAVRDEEGWGGLLTGVPPAKCQKLQLEGPVEDRSLVEVTMIEGMPNRLYSKAEALEACEHKIGDKTIRGPWRFEFDVPNP